MQWANAKPHIDGHLTRKTSPNPVDDSVMESRFASNIASQQCKRSLGNACKQKTQCMSLFVLCQEPHCQEPLVKPAGSLAQRSTRRWINGCP
jgi:hypothetical protein